MAEYKQIHKVEVEKKPKLTKKMIALLVIAIVLVVGVITAYIVTADKDTYGQFCKGWFNRSNQW